MSVIFAETNDQFCVDTAASWAGTRDASTCNAVASTSTNNAFTLYTAFTSGRGGALYYLRRAHFSFDLSGESGTATAATFSWYCDLIQSTAGSDLIATHMGTIDNNTGDWDDHANSEPHSGATTITTTLGYHDFTLNAAALTRINAQIGSGNYNLAIIDYDNDYLDVAPSNNTFTQVHGYFANYTGTSRDPKLTLTFGYGNTVMGVAGTSISTVKGVANANISEVMGV